MSLRPRLPPLPLPVPTPHLKTRSLRPRGLRTPSGLTPHRVESSAEGLEFLSPHSCPPLTLYLLGLFEFRIFSESEEKSPAKLQAEQASGLVWEAGGRFSPSSSVATYQSSHGSRVFSARSSRVNTPCTPRSARLSPLLCLPFPHGT